MLSESQSYEGLYQQHKESDPLPSSQSLQKIVDLARAILFPGYFGNSTINKHTIPYHIGVNVECLFNLLKDTGRSKNYTAETIITTSKL